jgi:hypothetical protein
MMSLNDSTFNAITKRLAAAKRLTVLHARTRLFCSECKAVKLVTDVFPNTQVALECGHRRELFNWTPEDAIEYWAEVKLRSGKGKKVSGNGRSQRLEVVHELDDTPAETVFVEDASYDIPIAHLETNGVEEIVEPEETSELGATA